MFKAARKSRPVPSPDAQGFNSSEVARICGVSLRQLQWWDERNVVSPRQDGHKRIYMTEEVVEISVIAELRRKGFSLQKIPSGATPRSPRFPPLLPSCRSACDRPGAATRHCARPTTATDAGSHRRCG